MKPVLLVMAAGLGSRYGGFKQQAPIDVYGHSIIDYSIYDAARAGFEQVVCVIAPERATVRVLPCGEKWYGITYMEDLPAVRNAIEKLGQRGEYPEALW